MKSWRPRSYAWARRRFPDWLTLTGAVGWEGLEGVERKGMRGKVDFMVNGARWKKVKDTCLKEVDQIEGNHEKGKKGSQNRLFRKISKFLKKVWLLSKRMFIWRLQIDLFSTYSGKWCVIDPSLTTGYGKPPRAFQQQAAVTHVVKLYVVTVLTWAMKKSWFSRVYRGLYYPVMWGLY